MEKRTDPITTTNPDSLGETAGAEGVEDNAADH